MRQTVSIVRLILCASLATHLVIAETANEDGSGTGERQLQSSGKFDSFARFNGSRPLPEPKQGAGEHTNKQQSGVPPLRIQVSAIFVDRSEFPLNELLFKLTLRLALEAAQSRLEHHRVKLVISFRSANTCSRQFAGALAAEEYYIRRARLFIVSGCDDAIRGVSRLASGWRVPIMTGAGFGADLNDKSIHRTLLRVAFSLRAAVDFLYKTMKLFQWRRINLLVDESDANSMALKEAIEKHSSIGAGHTSTTTNSSADYRLIINTISFDLQALLTGSIPVASGLNSTNSSVALNQQQQWANNEDKWPNEITNQTIQYALTQSSLFSRINVLLIPQQHLRRLMLSVHEQNMATGLYTFINMPLLLVVNDDQIDNSATADNSKQQSYATSTGENVFVWRSLRSSRNAQAKQAFESLMSIYLRTPTSKAYIYFASKVTNLANTDFTTTTTTQVSPLRGGGSLLHSKESATLQARVQLNINPYAASFYDCLQIYATVVDESLGTISRESNATHRRQLKRDLHARISELARNRRYENMVTGSILINVNGDRDTDYTLDDMNQLTGKFRPVVLYRGETREIERLAKVQWSSDSSVQQPTDTVDCNLIGTCARKPISRFSFILIITAIPLATITVGLLYFVHNRLSLESKLVDYWWRIHLNEIEIVMTRRKNANDGSLVLSGGGAAGAGSLISHSSKLLGSTGRRAVDGGARLKEHYSGSQVGTGNATTVTRATDSCAFVSSVLTDVCYGDITLGIYKLAKVALKPISKLHQSRKLMIELRNIRDINHNNLCRFIGIIIDQGNNAIVSEFCQKGSLREFFQNESMVIDWTFKYSIINDIITGLLYLHSSPIGFHGRLKSSNCLVSSRFVVKLADYGPHSLYEPLDDVNFKENETDWFMKRIWMAPEHMSKRSTGTKSGSTSGDVYSFGLLLYEIITNNLPFYNAKQKDYIMPLKMLYDELRHTGPSEQLGPDLSVIDTAEHNIGPLVDLMQSCWRFEPNKRPSSTVVGTAIKRITHGTTSRKLLDNLTTRMEQYTNNLESLVDNKLAILLEEKLKTEELLYQFVPKSIASLLKEGHPVEPEAFECVTVFYSDIVGFTSLSSESSPIEVIDFLSDLYLCFDETLEKHDIFKVDTVGDAYIVASGLPQRNEDKHIMEIACAALELRDRLAQFKIPHKPNRSLEMRVGIHSGPCVAGVVGGLNMPKYCVFGDTLTIGKFMESNGLPMKIHITEESKNLLTKAASCFKVEPRTPKLVRDGLPFQTYWLERSV